MFRRTLAAALIVAVGAVLLISSWPQLFGLGRSTFIAQVVSMRALAVTVGLIIVVALTLIALISRSTRRFAASIALIALIFCGVSAAVLATRGFGGSGFDTEGPNDIRVLSWNTLGEAIPPEAIAALAQESDADIVTLPETTNEAGLTIAAAMKARGRPMWVYTVAYDHISKARSTTLLISAALGEYQVNTSRVTTAVLPSVVATPRDGSGPTIIAVHAVSPIVGEMAHWRADLSWLKSACAGSNVIMAGDFNSTVDHYAGLANSSGRTLGDCADAGLASGNGSVGTWPTMLPALLGTPIDHVMTTQNWRVTGMRVVQSRDNYGSDHRPILVQLTPAG
ncbi:MAG: endonuclease/exonuclease/phosphatase family protein [Salinibacterium sp.]|nr:MAG: endonuclease/exonuclease/phosphatase family protein [Salinibacterium sp.]